MSNIYEIEDEEELLALIRKCHEHIVEFGGDSWWYEDLSSAEHALQLLREKK